MHPVNPVRDGRQASAAASSLESKLLEIRHQNAFPRAVSVAQVSVAGSHLPGQNDLTIHYGVWPSGDSDTLFLGAKHVHLDCIRVLHHCDSGHEDHYVLHVVQATPSSEMVLVHWSVHHRAILGGGDQALRSLYAEGSALGKQGGEGERSE